MPTPTLIIANKRYSSWSLRPWLALRVFNVPFTEQMSPFEMATNSAHFSDFSPTKKVPVLVDGETTIWESLAILEYVAEMHPQHRWWPADRHARGVARAIAAEMHAGFLALRNECPMNMQRTPGSLAISDQCRIDVTRVETLMSQCFDAHAGPFLFDTFGIVDAMLAPVVNRVRAYELTQHPAVMRFCDAIEALPAWQQWQRESAAEVWVVDAVEL
ncbi:MAG: glutathione S-transferase family protein [Pseudomonadota bacterium]